jgi:Domain of unknown function (DUF4336)
MPCSRSFIDRILRLATPRPVATFTPRLQELTSGVWVVDRQLRLPGGGRLPLRTTILQLSNGALVVISPPPLFGPDDVAAIDPIGNVKYVVAPNTFHYVYAGEFMALYPDASLLVAPGLLGRVTELPPADELGPKAPAAWIGELDLCVLGPVRGVSEVAFFHLSTGALILTDLAFNITRFPRAFDRIAWRLAGIPAGFGPSRTSRLLLLQDRAEASRCLSRVSEWPIRQIVVAHGEVVVDNAKTQLLKAFGRYLDNSLPLFSQS